MKIKFPSRYFHSLLTAVYLAHYSKQPLLAPNATVDGGVDKHALLSRRMAFLASLSVAGCESARVAVGDGFPRGDYFLGVPLFLQPLWRRHRLNTTWRTLVRLSLVLFCLTRAR